MKHKLLSAVAVTALIATPSFAAADDEGWYVRGNVGYGVHGDVDITGDVTGDVESEGNGALSVGAGYDFGNNWRLEGDFGSLFTDLGAISQGSGTTSSLRTNSVMINALYDFEEFGAWRPYVGAGLGFAESSATISAHDFVETVGGQPALISTPACEFGSCDINDDGGSLAWQLLAGVGFAVTDKLTWDTQYRYLDAGSVDVAGLGTNFANGVAQSTSNISAELDDVVSHSILTGFRYRFGGSAAPVAAALPTPVAPPPAPTTYTCWDGSSVLDLATCPAQPAPQVQCWDGSTADSAASCPSRPTITCWDGSLAYEQASCPVQQLVGRTQTTVAALCGNQYRQEIIYYEFDKGQSAETRNTINRILDVGQYCNVDNIRVVGHTDTSGSAAYNLNLSKRRAKDARDELVRQGIRSDVISSEGKGETEPFVDTGDGVKEQLNRRTEVLISLSETGGIIN
ncbi:MAG: OmpA family protein [Maricaulaceae bacterium]